MTEQWILAMLKLNDDWPHDDSVSWCSAFVNDIALLLGLNSPKSLRARSWVAIKKILLMFQDTAKQEYLA